MSVPPRETARGCDGGPVTEAELDDLFAPCAAFDIVFLAVSGGADSTALMHLAAKWQETRQATSPELRVLTVDHGLRPEAASEAEAVVAAATRLGMRADVLTWRGAIPSSGVQAAARDLRYRLMLAHIEGERRGRGAGRSQQPARRLALVTAHHRDDLAETVLMRLARGAGVDGLAAIRPSSARGAITLLRPLLALPKARLEATLSAGGLTWAEDPSNANPDFERIRLRRAALSRDDLGLTAQALARTAGRMQRAAAALEDITTRHLSATLDDPALLRAGAFRWRWPHDAMSDEIALRVLARVLAVIGGSSAPPQLRRIERLYADMQLESFAGATLGRCVIAVGKGGAARSIIYREPAREPLPTVTSTLERPLIWDSRFRIASAAPGRQRLHVRPYAPGDLELFDFDAAAMLPYPIEALAATPVVVAGDQTPAAPPFWIPALDVHRSGENSAAVAALDCRFRVAGLTNRPGATLPDES